VFVLSSLLDEVVKRAIEFEAKEELTSSCLHLPFTVLRYLISVDPPTSVPFSTTLDTLVVSAPSILTAQSHAALT
jgi:hypothetical protein